MSEPPLKQGSIARAWFTPTLGPRKFRTVAVFTPDSVLRTATHADVVMISTSCYADDPDSISLPFHPEGKVSTRLRKPSALKMTEIDSVPIRDIEPTWGFVPDPQRAEMLHWLKRSGRLP